MLCEHEVADVHLLRCQPVMLGVVVIVGGGDLSKRPTSGAAGRHSLSDKPKFVPLPNRTAEHLTVHEVSRQGVLVPSQPKGSCRSGRHAPRAVPQAQGQPCPVQPEPACPPRPCRRRGIRPSSSSASSRGLLGPLPPAVERGNHFQHDQAQVRGSLLSKTFEGQVNEGAVQGHLPQPRRGHQFHARTWTGTSGF